MLQRENALLCHFNKREDGLQVIMLHNSRNIHKQNSKGNRITHFKWKILMNVYNLLDVEISFSPFRNKEYHHYLQT